MKKKTVKRILSLVLTAAMTIGIPQAAFAAEEKDEIKTTAATETVDAGLYATPSTDFVSAWENLNGINNPDFEPVRSNAGNGQGWGNWEQKPGSVHWVQYDWESAITADSFQVYWYDDGGGTRVPSAIQFQYKDEQGVWKDLTMKSSLADVTKIDQYNTIEVEEVTTNAIRFNVTVREGAAANGIYRWKVNAQLNDATTAMALSYEKEKLAIGDRMTSDTILPVSLPNGVSVSWTEDHPAIVIEGGKAVVTRGDTDVSGKMTATLSLNGKKETKEFTIVVPKKTDAIPDMLAKYDFSNLSGGLSEGASITDVSGHDNDATVKGSGVTAIDNTLKLTTNGGYVQLPTGMFDKQDNLTISMWIKNDQGPAWTSAFFFGKNTTSYFMINPQNPTSQAAKMVLTWAGSDKEIGMAPGSDLSAGPVTGSEWTHYIATISEKQMTAYINGEKYASYPLTKKISDMGTDLTSYIGRSEYGDPFFKGQLKNVSIYSKAVTDAQAGGLYTEGLTEDEILQNASDGLTIPEVKEGALSTRMVDKLTLKDQMISGLVNITWKSGNKNIITDDGKVTAPAKNTSVKMTATIKVGEKTKTKDFNIMVLDKESTTYSMTVDKKDTGIDISQELFGLFYEDINSSADGGLSPELVKNNSFQNYADGSAPTNPVTYGDQTSWKKYWTSSNPSGFVIEQKDGLNANNKNYAKLTGNQILSNVGFTTMWNNTKPSIPIKEGTKFDFSMWMKAEASYAGKITVQVTDANGQALTDVKTLTLKKDGQWNKISAVLTGAKTATGQLVLTITEGGVSDVIYADMISLASQDTYGYGNKNYARGAGLRKDLVETLMDLSPSFIRFPGGCAIEGDFGPDSFYNWENSIGALEERKAQASYWGDHTIGKNPDPDYGYMMSFELGYHEILTLCEDMGAEAFPIMSAGIYCQFANNAPPAKSGEELDPFAQNAINLLNYCWGDPDSSDKEEAKWAKKRVENGHAEPFDLHYVGIGNENWNTKDINYYANFKYIKDKIDAFKKAHYPDHQLQIIMAYGPYHWNISPEDAYSYVKREMTGEVLMDEHYYAGANWMLDNTHRYDSYDRLDEDGTNVFVGEYAVNDKGNTLEGAIAEAAYMTGFERNADIVRHASYAPLLSKQGANNWSPNMIYFDEYNVLKTPNYYVQWMYANNYGEKLVNTTLDRVDGTGAYKAMSDTQKDIYQVSSADDKYIYLKLVNSADYAKDITVDFKDVTAKEAEVISISGNAKDANQMGNEIVKPVTAKEKLQDGKLLYEVPAMSFTVVKVATDGSVVEDPVDKSALDAAIKAAVSDTDKDKYTGASWKRYANALKSAKEVQADKDATQEEVDSAVKALTDAQKALKESKPVEDIFKDIRKSDWYRDNVQYVYDNEYMTGLNKEEFGPEVVLSRSHFATILYRIEGEPDVEYDEKFTDVPDNDFYTDAVMWASSEDVKVIAGYLDGRFGPADAITREQFATMMYRYAKYKGYDIEAADDLKEFPDAGKVSPFAEDAIKWAVAEGLIKGDNGNIDPQGEANRAECATIIRRFMENVAK